MQGLKKMKGESQPRRALPLTLPLLGKLNRSVLRAKGGLVYRQLNLSAALELGFACFFDVVNSLTPNSNLFTIYRERTSILREPFPPFASSTARWIRPGRGGFCRYLRLSLGNINESVLFGCSLAYSNCSRLRRMIPFFPLPRIYTISLPAR